MIIRKIRLTEYEYQPPINFVAGATEPDIQFQLADYTIPAGATARCYVQRFDGTFEYTVATIDGNNVTVEPTSSMFSVRGEGAIQITLYAGEEVLKNFSVPVFVHADLADENAEQGSDVTGIFRAAEEQALEDFAEDAEAKAAEVIESIPADYTELTEEVSELNERLGDIDTEISERLAQNDDILKLKEKTAIEYEIGDQNHSIQYATGALSSSTTSTYSATDYVDISKFSEIEFKRPGTTNSSSSAGMAFYDASKTYISGIVVALNKATAGYLSEMLRCDVPTDACYARFSVYQDTTTYGDFAINGYPKLSSAIESLHDEIYDVYNGKRVIPVNWLNPEEIETGKILNSDGTVSSDSAYNTSGLTEIEKNKEYAVITGVKTSDPTQRTIKSVLRVCFYDSNEEVIGSGTKGSYNEFPILAGAKYIRFCAPNTNSPDLWTQNLMIEYVDNVTNISDVFVKYDEKTTPGINDLVEEISELSEAVSEYDEAIDEIYIGKPLPIINWLDPEEIEVGKRLQTNGTLTADTGYNTSGYIPVELGKAYAVVTGKVVSNPTSRNTKTLFRVIFYDQDKLYYAEGTQGDNKEISIPQGAVYMRFCAITTATPPVWDLSPMVEYVNSVDDISDVFVPYTDEPQRTHGLNYLDNAVTEMSEAFEEISAEITDEIEPILNNDLIGELSYEGYSGGHAINGDVGSAIVDNTTSNWRYTMFDISGYARIAVSTIIYGSTYHGVVFTDDENIIISKALYKGENTAETVTDQWVDVPQYATRAYVNKRSSTQGDKATVKVSINAKNLINHIDQEKYELTLFAVNCGGFDYGDGTTTDDEYKANWRTVLNKTQADVFAMSDCPRVFGDLADDSPVVLFGNTIKEFINNNSYNSGLALATRLKADFVEQIDVGGGDSARRKLVSKFKVRLMGKDIYIYVGHYQPEQSNTSIRATQYANVIADAKTNKYQYVIFCGDFNAWSISEYAPFTAAGYIVCNGGYMGDYVTLRDIPADNIIYSPNIMEKHFEVITGANLNTDHSPIVATLIIRP